MISSHFGSSVLRLYSRWSLGSSGLICLLRVRQKYLLSKGDGWHINSFLLETEKSLLPKGRHNQEQKRGANREDREKKGSHPIFRYHSSKASYLKRCAGQGLYGFIHRKVINHLRVANTLHDVCHALRESKWWRRGASHKVFQAKWPFSADFRNLRYLFWQLQILRRMKVVRWDRGTDETFHSSWHISTIPERFVAVCFFHLAGPR